MLTDQGQHAGNWITTGQSDAPQAGINSKGILHV
jgi:hypothetical protein